MWMAASICSWDPDMETSRWSFWRGLWIVFETQKSDKGYRQLPSGLKEDLQYRFKKFKTTSPYLILAPVNFRISSIIAPFLPTIHGKCRWWRTNFFSQSWSFPICWLLCAKFFSWFSWIWWLWWCSIWWVGRGIWSFKLEFTVICRNKTSLAADFIRKGVLFWYQ